MTFATFLTRDGLGVPAVNGILRAILLFVDSPSFAGLALGRGWLTQAQIDECLGIQTKIIEAGVDSTLEEVLLKKNYLTKQQVAAINSLLGKGVKGSIEGYEILEKIAQGGMGAVYKAKQNSMNRTVAIKVLLPKFARDPDAVERFTREARAVAKLSHPNIVAGIDAGVANGIYYYAMEFLDGESMEKSVARRGALPWQEAARIIRQVASALDHAHRQGFVHRDIKPSNIILLKDGTAKLADLGLARLSAGEEINVTQSGTVLGTPGYISPEQARGDKTLDIRSDLYSLGLTFYEFLVGLPAYSGDNAFAVIEQHCTKDVPVDRLPREVAQIVQKMSARNRDTRYQSPADLVADIDTVLKGGHVAPPEKKTARRMAPAPLPKKPPLALIAGAAVAVVAGVLVVAFARPGPAPVAPPPKPEPVSPVVKEVPKEDAPGLTDADRTAIKLLKFAQEYESENPGRHAEALGIYQKALDAAKGTPALDLAKSKVDELTKAVADRAAADSRIDAEIRDLVAAGRYGAARDAAVNAATLFPEETWRQQCAARTGGVLDRARAACAALLAKTDPSLFENVAFGIEELDAAIARRRRELANVAPTDVPDDSRLMDDALPGIIRAAKDLEFAAGERMCEQILAKLTTPAGRERFTTYRDWFAPAALLVREARQRLASLRPGMRIVLELRASKVEGIVKAASADGVLLEGDRSVPFAELSVGMLFMLVDGPKRTDIDPRGILLAAVYAGDFAIAEKAAEALLRIKAPIPQFVADDFLALRQAEAARQAAAQRRDKDAEQLLQEAEKALLAKKLDDAVAKLDKFGEEYGTTPFARKNDKRIKAANAALPREIVIYAADVKEKAREWQLVDDKDAASGKTLLSAARRNYGGPFTGTPPFVEFKFTALKELKYTLWMRQRRGADPAMQNALWMQISDAVGPTGRDWFPVGGREAYMMQFFTGEGRETPMKGWTATDQYNLPRRDLATVQFNFKSSGEKTLRISICEDGTGFDQVVISSAKYLKSPPDVDVVPRAKK